MAQQNLSTTRQRQVSIPANSRITVDFTDTKPNYFYLNNLSVSEVYLGVSMIPDNVKYDKKVGPSQEALFAREQGVKSIQLYNATGAPARIDLTTFEKEFDPLVLASSSTTVSGGGGGDYDGVIRGFTAPLPAGNNDIGKVVVTEMPEIVVAQGPLQEGTANIGKVQVTSLPSLPTGNANIGNVGILGGVTIESMPPVQVTNDPVRGSHQYYEANVSTSAVTYDMTPFDVIKISYIINDDPDNDLFILFVGSTPTPLSVGGRDGTIRLGPGEQISELTRKTSRISFIRQNGSGRVRMLGV